MPIDFRCTQCGKLLRTPDDSGGKQAKCPQCGAILAIPQPGAAVAPQSLSPPVDDPFAAIGSPPPLSDPTNPYASPQYTGTVPQRYDTHEREGPPWERDGASFSSFSATAREVIGRAASTFRDMRREGGLGAPMGFAVAGNMIGFLIGTPLQLMLEGVFQAGDPFRVLGAMQGAMTLILGAVFVPIVTIVGLLIGSAITHVMLIILGGAPYPYETTFRVNAYTSGATSLLNVIPWIGSIIGTILYVVIEIIGLIHAQEVPTWRAILAVLLPILLCGAVLGAVFFAAFAGGGLF